MIAIFKKRLSIKCGFLACFLMFFIMSCSASEPNVSPQEFWVDFKQAVLSNDTKALIGKTHFPLELRGVDDSQPVVFYDKNQFKEVFAKAVNQTVVSMQGDDFILKTTKEILISTAAITSEHMLTKDSFRIDQLMFELKNNQWKLVRIYLEE